MRTVPVPRVAACLAVIVVGLAGCGTGSGAAADARPDVVVTTSVLGDVVQNLLGAAARVTVVMPSGSNPHDFAPSARQVDELRRADAVVQNGGGFEVGLVDTIDAAARDGSVVITATDGVDLLGDDPHFFTDPLRMRAAAAHISEALAARVPALDSAEVRRRTAAYLAQLDALDRDVERLLAPVAPQRRLLVTNHEVFAYFADRYGFTIVGSVIPSGTTLAEPSASGLQQLAAAIKRTRVPAIFAETSAPTRLADALAAEGTDVAVVSLYSESLGGSGSDGATYLDMMRTNAARIAAALG
ncbi:MAG: metal ABC transporter solute-binding protein, Zn/Mn family [Microthrixaceae bacterium]